MSGERCCPGAAWMVHVRWCVNYPEHTPTPVPSEVAETTAGEREVSHNEPITNTGGAGMSHNEHATEPDAGEVEGLDVVTLHDKMLGLAWSCTCGAIGAGAIDPIRKAARDHQRAHLAALLDRVRREEGERIAQAIERQASCGIADRGHDGCYVSDSLAIARAASVDRGEGL